MESREQADTTNVANNNAQSNFPLVPRPSSLDLNSLPAVLCHPPIPLSLLESLPVEIHILIVGSVLNNYGSDQPALAALARTAPAFTQLARRSLYESITIYTREAL